MSLPAAFSAKARKKEGLINTVRKQASDQGLEVQEGEEGLNQDREEETGSFVGFVLLAGPMWDRSQFKSDMESMWGIECVEEEDAEENAEEDAEEEEAEDDAGGSDHAEDVMLFNVNNMRVMAALMDVPVPDKEAEIHAANNYMWPEAVEIVKTHQAQLIVAIMGKDAPVLERGKLFVKVLAALCRQKNVLGIYTSGTVFQPQFYLDASEMLRDGGLPILNWIYFGLYQTEKGWNTYTYGMKSFGKDEMEILEAGADPRELRDFLLNLACYVLDEDVVLRDGETIGFSAQQKLPIVRSKGVSLDGDTLKIAYPTP